MPRQTKEKKDKPLPTHARGDRRRALGWMRVRFKGGLQIQVHDGFEWRSLMSCASPSELVLAAMFRLGNAVEEIREDIYDLQQRAAHLQRRLPDLPAELRKRLSLPRRRTP